MKSPLWTITLGCLDRVDELCHQAVGAMGQGVRRQTASETGEARPSARRSGAATDLHFDAANELRSLQSRLRGRLSEQDVYHVLFALVIYLDEKIQMRVLRDHDVAWPLLQEELLGVDDGGDLFYEATDEHLRSQETNPFVLEVYYFCLKAGFVGRYESQPARIDAYVRRLEGRFGDADPTAAHDGQPITDAPPPTHPYRIYAAAAVAVLVGHGVIWWFTGLLHLPGGP